MISAILLARAPKALYQRLEMLANQIASFRNSRYLGYGCSLFTRHLNQRIF